MNTEVSKDLIELVNGMNDFVKSKSVSYFSKNKKDEWVETKFDYVPLDDILDRVKQSTKWAIQQLMSSENGMPTIETILTHESGEVVSSGKFPLIFSQNAKSQDVGAVITYMKRYQLGSFLGLATETDNDANFESEVKNLKVSDKTLMRLVNSLSDEEVDKILSFYKITKLNDITEDNALKLLAKKGK